MALFFLIVLLLPYPSILFALWQPLETQISGDIGTGSLAVQEGVPYLAYTDDSRDGRASLRRWEKDGWILVGKKGFSQGIADLISLSFVQGEPLVVYRDTPSRGKAYAARYGSQGWMLQPLSRGEAFGPALVSDGVQAYVSFRDEVKGGRLSVLSLQGETWVPIGQFGKTFSSALALNPEGRLTLAYENWEKNSRASFLTLDKTLWSGLPELPQRKAQGISLAYGNGLTALYGDGEGRIRAARRAQHIDWRWRPLGRVLSPKGLHPSLIFGGGALYGAWLDLKKEPRIRIVREKNGVWEELPSPMPAPAEDTFISLSYGEGLYMAYRNVYGLISVIKWKE